MPRRSQYEGEEPAGFVYITLKAYLARLKAIEEQQPPAYRRHIPSLRELAKVVGIHPVTMTKLAGGKMESINLQTAARIMTEVRRRGFMMDIADFFAYTPPSDLSEQKP